MLSRKHFQQLQYRDGPDILDSLFFRISMCTRVRCSLFADRPRTGKRQIGLQPPQELSQPIRLASAPHRLFPAGLANTAYILAGQRVATVPLGLEVREGPLSRVGEQLQLFDQPGEQHLFFAQRCPLQGVADGAAGQEAPAGRGHALLLQRRG